MENPFLFVYFLFLVAAADSAENDDAKLKCIEISFVDKFHKRIWTNDGFFRAEKWNPIEFCKHAFFRKKSESLKTESIFGDKDLTIFFFVKKCTWYWQINIV